MTPHATRTWLNYLLGVACVGAIVAAFLVVGPASGSQATVTRTAERLLNPVMGKSLVVYADKPVAESARADAAA